MALRLWDASNAGRYELRGVLPLKTLADFKAPSTQDVALPADLEVQLDELSPELKERMDRTERFDELPQLNSGGLLHFAFSREGRELLLGGWNNPIRVLDIAAIEAEWALAPDVVERRVQEHTGLRLRDGRLELIPRNRLMPVAD